MIWKLVLLGLGGYMALCAMVFLLQRKMLYFPGRMVYSKEMAERAGLRHWPSEKNFRGFATQKDLPDAKGTIILFHGNAGTAFDRSFYSEALSKLGMRVILAEYPGYGGRHGNPKESVLVRDAVETIEAAFREYGGPVFLWGESLGCGVAAHAARQTQVPFKAMVLFLPWDSLASLAQTHYWYFPARWLVRDQYNSIDHLKGFNNRVAVLLAGEDEVVPVKHGKNLFDSLTVQKKLWIFDESDHNDVPVDPHLDWWQEVVAFILRE